MKKVLAITALVGAAGAATTADAAPQPATLLSVVTYSKNGFSSFNLSASTATWTFDTVTGTAAIASGTYYGEVLSPNVFGHTMTGVSLGNFIPTLGTWSCQEGNFGSAVGASLCGNYNFGSNKKNQSTYTPTAQGATVTLGGDDALLSGSPQSLQTSYSNMDTNAQGSGVFLLSNAAPGTCTNPFCSGYDFVFDTVLPPKAVNDSFATYKNKAISLPILANDLNWTDPVSVALFNLPTHGSALVTGSPGAQSGIRIDYTPAPGFTGTDTFQYVVDDGTDADIANVTVTVNPTFAVNDSAGTVAPSPVVIDVLGNDVGFVDPVTAGIVVGPSHGSVVIEGSPGNMAGITVTYTPAIGFTGTDTFDYSVDDGVNADSGTVTVVVVQDTDGDGVYDHQDNCRTIANTNQRDTNSDGYGNLCDADLDNNGFVNFTDLSLFKQKFTTADPDANLDGIGIVNFSDLAIFKSLFGKAPGPSGLVP